MKIIHQTQKEYIGRDLEAMSFAANYHRWIFDRFKPYLGERVAEVGAGSGGFSTFILAAVSELTAFEPSSKMFNILLQRIGSQEHVTLFNSTFGELSNAVPQNYDSIIYVNVLEHVKDHKAEVAEIYARLSPGGFALVFVPALSCLYSQFDKKIGHIRRYHRNPLCQLFETAGFDITKCHYFDIFGIVPWYVTMVLMKRELSTLTVSWYDRFVVPIARCIENVITPPIGKNLLLIAQKPKSAD